LRNDRLSDAAWKLFEHTTPGWPRGAGDLRFRAHHIASGYAHARATMTAWEAFNEGKGVCRDYAHLAIALCRCMNIPARLLHRTISPKSACRRLRRRRFRRLVRGLHRRALVHFDARNNIPRIGRVLIAQGRDAADVPITQDVRAEYAASFTVFTDEVA